MRNFSLLTIFCFLVFQVFNYVMAETYYCSGSYRTEDGMMGFFSGDFDPASPKPDINRCEYLKSYELSYSSCKDMLKTDLDSYNRGHSAYQSGQCHKYQNITHRYGTSTCSAKYVVTKDGYSMQGIGSTGKKSDSDACFEQLNNRIINTQKLLKEQQKEN